MTASLLTISTAKNKKNTTLYNLSHQEIRAMTGGGG